MSPESSRPAGKGRHRLFALLAVVIGVLSGLAVAEIAVRVLLRYNTPETVRAHSLQYLPSVYARHRLTPGQDFDAGLAWGAPAKGASPGPRPLG